MLRIGKASHRHCFPREDSPSHIWDCAESKSSIRKSACAVSKAPASSFRPSFRRQLGARQRGGAAARHARDLGKVSGDARRSCKARRLGDLI
eukprot:3664081-Pleurochrysis_carterae.AAC.1